MKLASPAPEGACGLTIVLDVRSCIGAPHSGIGRYTISLASALHNAGLHDPGLRIVFAGPRQFNVPDAESGRSEVFVVGSWLARVCPKPRFVWATWALLLFLVREFFSSSDSKGQRFVWVAPDNIDRPLVVPRLPSFVPRMFSVRVVQIVHDLIPIVFPSQSNALLRWQFRLLLRGLAPRWLWLAPVSPLTMGHLDSFLKGRGPRISSKPLGSCVHPEFLQSLVRVNGLSVQRFLEEFEKELPAVHQIITSQGGRFVLGVGRDEPYKNWSVASAWLAGLAAAHNPPETKDGKVQRALWFVHVCPVVLPGGAYSSGAFGIAETVALDALEGAGWVYPSAGVLRLEKLTDRQLALLYRGAEALGHFSELEGFGLPIVEAYLAGLGIQAAAQSGCKPFLESLDDGDGVHFFDGDPESISQSWDPNTVRIPWTQSIETRTLRSRQRLSSSAVMDILGSPAAMSKALLDLAREQVPH